MTKTDAIILYEPIPATIPFHESPVLYRLLQGGKDCSKSYSIAGEIISLCVQYPGSKWLVARTTIKQLKKTIIPTYLKILKKDIRVWKLYIKNWNRSEMILTFMNDSQILFQEINVTSDPHYDNIQGMEITGFSLEEACQFQKDAFIHCQNIAGRWKAYDADGNECPPYGFLFDKSF